MKLDRRGEVGHFLKNSPRGPGIWPRWIEMPWLNETFNSAFSHTDRLISVKYQASGAVPKKCPTSPHLSHFTPLYGIHYILQTGLKNEMFQSQCVLDYPRRDRPLFARWWVLFARLGPFGVFGHGPPELWTPYFCNYKFNPKPLVGWVSGIRAIAKQSLLRRPWPHHPIAQFQFTGIIYWRKVNAP